MCKIKIFLAYDSVLNLDYFFILKVKFLTHVIFKDATNKSHTSLLEKKPMSQ